MADTTMGAELLEGMAPLESEGLQILADAIGSMGAELELLVREDAEGNAPWSIIHDADRAPVEYLPYIAQFPGQEIPVGTPVDEARELIKAPANQERGGVEKMRYECQKTLTGTKYVKVIERDGDE